MLSRNQRLKAIFRCFYFGILPWQVYEKKCHYSVNGDGEGAYTYFKHLKLNLQIAKHLILKTEHPCTHDFHKAKVRYFRFQRKGPNT